MNLKNKALSKVCKESKYKFRSINDNKIKTTNNHPLALDLIADLDYWKEEVWTDKTPVTKKINNMVFSLHTRLEGVCCDGNCSSGEISINEIPLNVTHDELKDKKKRDSTLEGEYLKKLDKLISKKRPNNPKSVGEFITELVDLITKPYKVEIKVISTKKNKDVEKITDYSNLKKDIKKMLIDRDFLPRKEALQPI